MASYFDLPPQTKAKAAATALPESERGEWTGTSLLSPQVTQLLAELDLEDRSSSDSEEGSLSEEDIQPKHSSKGTNHHGHKNKQVAISKKAAPSTHPPRKSALDSSSTSTSSQVNNLPPRPGSGAKSVGVRQPHMNRFHSLRSILFLSKIEQNLMEVKREDRVREEAASEWKNQHDQRQIGKPKTPEKELTPKDGLSRRITTRIRRMTSRDVPTMGQIREGVDDRLDGRESTASSDNEDEQTSPILNRRNSDEGSIDHSDLDDLMRWVSRQDPPSDGEVRKRENLNSAENHGAHESLGDSDVDELVQWASRKSDPEGKEQPLPGYSDASTESDSEAINGSSNDEDADELVRWISRREGPNAGPARQKALPKPVYLDEDSEVSQSDRSMSRHDGKNGGSNLLSKRVASTHQDDDSPGSPRGRPIERSSPNKLDHNLTDDDVNGLVQWVSRKDSNQQNTLEDDARVLALQHQGNE
ncbi:hypothetical protein P153DRAFT_430600 [Dothidotthia symphoricarpi CBS 119687]|uniref:Uncharacterized protein n=1 Tax=Dothidotthia symphoricarpi CBS 119687 TaxID=1392245 RepID=A0A6A6AEJ5_9PLEO|nr:uncharacterized protein P153DRAFT_430600 [Dothidotthia symphoricarpi CBS 119687]KAF2130372.1 hypothetical protein P153DRAFT_430600 [Dothidotthia symphoricarpi CBS 119687]